MRIAYSYTAEWGARCLDILGEFRSTGFDVAGSGDYVMERQKLSEASGCSFYIGQQWFGPFDIAPYSDADVVLPPESCGGNIGNPGQEPTPHWIYLEALITYYPAIRQTVIEWSLYEVDIGTSLQDFIDAGVFAPIAFFRFVRNYGGASPTCVSFVQLAGYEPVGLVDGTSEPKYDGDGFGLHPSLYTFDSELQCHSISTFSASGDYFSPDTPSPTPFTGWPYQYRTMFDIEWSVEFLGVSPCPSNTPSVACLPPPPPPPPPAECCEVEDGCRPVDQDPPQLITLENLIGESRIFVEQRAGCTCPGADPQAPQGDGVYEGGYSWRQTFSFGSIILQPSGPSGVCPTYRALFELPDKPMQGQIFNGCSCAPGGLGIWKPLIDASSIELRTIVSVTYRPDLRWLRVLLRVVRSNPLSDYNNPDRLVVHASQRGGASPINTGSYAQGNHNFTPLVIDLGSDWEIAPPVGACLTGMSFSGDVTFDPFTGLGELLDKSATIRDVVTFQFQCQASVVGIEPCDELLVAGAGAGPGAARFISISELEA